MADTVILKVKSKCLDDTKRNLWSWNDKSPCSWEAKLSLARQIYFPAFCTWYIVRHKFTWSELCQKLHLMASLFLFSRTVISVLGTKYLTLGISSEIPFFCIVEMQFPFCLRQKCLISRLNNCNNLYIDVELLKGENSSAVVLWSQDLELGGVTGAIHIPLVKFFVFLLKTCSANPSLQLHLFYPLIHCLSKM